MKLLRLVFARSFPQDPAPRTTCFGSFYAELQKKNKKKMKKNRIVKICYAFSTELLILAFTTINCTHADISFLSVIDKVNKTNYVP